MDFIFTPDEAQATAIIVARQLEQQGLNIAVEVSLNADAPLRTTLVARKSGFFKLVEAQRNLHYGKVLKELALWLAANRYYGEFFIAVPHNATMQASLLDELKKDGVGLLIVGEDETIKIHLEAKNPALVVTPDPSLKYGKCRIEVQNAVEKFNNVNRKDGLRDMCELVERETEILAKKASAKGFITIPLTAIEAQDWSGKINTLASTNACASGRAPLFDAKLKDDMHSFRGARNLIDHPPKGKRDDARRQRQFAERMMQGPRLIAELVSLNRKIR